MTKRIMLTVILMEETVVELVSTQISALIVIVWEELLVMESQIFWLAMESVMRRPITNFVFMMALTVVGQMLMEMLVMVIKSPTLPAKKVWVGSGLTLILETELLELKCKDPLFFGLGFEIFWVFAHSRNYTSH